MGLPLAHNSISGSRKVTRIMQIYSILALLCLSFLVGRRFYTVNFRVDIQRRTEFPKPYKCKPPLPKLLLKYPPVLNQYPSLQWAAFKLDAQLAARAALPDIDSLVAAVVTPAGVLWSKGYGRRHANETGNTAPPDLDTSYRIASISKMFATLETLVLRKHGALNLYVNPLLPCPVPRLIGAAETTRLPNSCPISLKDPTGGKNTWTGLARRYMNTAIPSPSGNWDRICPALDEIIPRSTFPIGLISAFTMTGPLRVI
jgi:Beta-lactamase